eukprot:TRINITY_DN1113_c0_g1_i1.p1 TRINITY_DN1113_c0_g1~~TRINITY_DN1113_c0_g1_i1.p1  ORF type:complete len:533 (-),score=116.74 TRINITY_DN1113_c0_g1_i1:36-1634(-)
MKRQEPSKARFTFPELSPQTIALLERKSSQFSAITFDEITLEDLPSDFHPNDVSLSSYITRNIALKGCGVMSAAMDTVTEAKMALAMAKMGGIGVLHRNLSIEEQAEQVKWVRRKIHSGGMIDKPIVFKPADRVSKIQNMITLNDWHFTSFPIVDDDGKLVGLMTRDEMEFIEEGNPTVNELMKKLETIVTCPEGTETEEAYKIMKQKRVKKLPIVSREGHLKGMYVWGDVKGDQNKRDLFSLDDDGHFLVAAAVSFSLEDMARIDRLVENGCKVIVLDSSHGACLPAKEQMTRIRAKYGNKVDIIVGNVASYDSAMYLLQGDAKPDGIKVGIGPGSICTTRQVTGHGIPQVTAVFNVWKAIRDHGKETGYYCPVIADGGLKNSGDIVKVFSCGASAVMLGSMLAGSEESPGLTVVKDGKRYKTIRGMGSRSAMEERSGSRSRYLRDKGTEKSETITVQQKQKMVPEGVEGLVEFKGTVEKIMTELSGGIQSGLAHSGANSILMFQKKAKIWEQSTSGIVEGNPHNVFNVTY